MAITNILCVCTVWNYSSWRLFVIFSFTGAWQACFSILHSSSGVHRMEDRCLQFAAEASCCCAGTHGFCSTPCSILCIFCFFLSGNIFKNYFTIFRSLSAPVPFPPKVRYASGRKGFLGEFVDNLRQEFNKNQEMKDNIKKFRDEAKRLEESDALQQARRKYVRFSYFRVKFLCEPESNFSVWDDFSHAIFFYRNLLRQRRWRLQRFSRRLLALCPILLGR